MRRLTLLLPLLTGCYLDELLYPSPPPPAVKCFSTLTITMVNSWGDTTIVQRGIERPCTPADSTNAR